MANQSMTKAADLCGSEQAAVQRLFAEHARTQQVAAAIKEAVRAHSAQGISATTKGIHELHRLLDERAFYPAHDKRTESPEYGVVHKRLCVTMDLPCLICGVRNSTLGDPAANRYGARAMETHHHVIEWSLAKAVDVDRFNKTIRPHLAARNLAQPIYQRDMTQQEVSDWVDHSEDNLWVLCDVHHRHKYLGIHEISYPIWCSQDLLSDDFRQYVKEHTPAVTAPRKAKATTKKKAAGKAKVTTKKKATKAKATKTKTTKAKTAKAPKRRPARAASSRKRR